MTADNRPVLFLDVDGVLNTGGQTWPRHWPTWHTAEVYNSEDDFFYPFGWADGVVDTLTALHERVEVLWLTTWGDDAPRYVAPALGLEPGKTWQNAHLLTDVPRRPNPDDDEYYAWAQPWRRTWFKRRVIEDLMLGRAQGNRFVGRPVIWADDDARKNSRRGMDSLTEAGFLALVPFSNVGLTPEHFARVEKFLADREF